MSEETLKTQVEEDLRTNKIVVYIKGSKQMPVCGFSAKVVRILNSLGVDYLARNALEDEHYRAVLKSITDWHTIPQVFIDGEFVGGCDILCELDASGDLKEMVTPSTVG